MPTALVTGGGIRVGRAIVLALGRAGYNVIVHANRSVDQAAQVVEVLLSSGVQARVEQADVSDVSQVQKLAARVDALDVLVNSAAAYEHVSFQDVTPAQFAQMYAVNAAAPFFLTQALLPKLKASSGCVVNITDMAVTHPYSASHAFSHYLASKAALEQLTRAWALELGPYIRVNAVAPGAVAMASETTTQQREEMLKRIPLRREGTPEDIAQAVVFLAQAPYITGQTIRVDGGLSIAC